MFKKCLNCDHTWESLPAFIGDKSIQFIGYQAYFDQARSGLFLFNHNCDTTLAIKLTEFEELVYGKICVTHFVPRSYGCPGHCADTSNLDGCQNSNCKGRSIRDLIQLVKSHSSWERNFQKLQEYKLKNGHCNVPMILDDTAFAIWVYDLRLNSERMSNERRKRLDRIGFSWSIECHAETA